MVWRRDDDQHRQRVVWERVSYQARWHYDCLVEECCRRELWDGVMTLKRACRVSDVDDPAACVAELAAVGLLDTFAGGSTDDGLVRLPEIDRHIPDEAARVKRKREQDAKRKREQRKRACAAGKHSKDCPPATCPEKPRARSVELPSPGQVFPVPVPVPVPGRPRDASVTHARPERDAQSGATGRGVAS